MSYLVRKIKGPIVDTFKKLAEDMFKGKATAKGALIITPERIIVTTPGADNKSGCVKAGVGF